MERDFWNSRYTAPEYVYGTTPNEFLVDCLAHIPAGPVLCLGDGEGRNGVFMAGRGYAVTAVDQSAVGMAKAGRLASQRGTTIQTTVADLTEFAVGSDAWAGIISIFVHLLPAARRSLHQRAVAGLQPGGVMVLEAYTPAQVRFRTGGPLNEPERFMTLADLREDFSGLEFLIARELERDVREGDGHTGRGAVVQILARKP